MEWLFFNLPILLSVLPIVIFVFFLIFWKISLLKSSLAVLAIFSILAIFYWQISPSAFMISCEKGFFVAFDIFIIIFGAIFFLKILENFQVINNVSYYLEHLSRDYRVQIIILAWFFENFIEGTAGFGTPVAVVAPLLVGLGLPPIKALVVSLLGNSASVVFGAAGTPIRTGFAGLNVSGVSSLSALINCVGFIVPIFMLWIITNGRSNRREEFFEALPFAIFSGIVFVVPSWLISFFGSELPSIVGSFLGLLLAIVAIKVKILIPQKALSLERGESLKRTMSGTKAFLPYGLLIILLIAGKFILGESGIKVLSLSGQIFKLFNPGFAFILAGLFLVFFWTSKGKNKNFPIKTAFQGSFLPMMVILSMSIFVQLMIMSGQNESGIPAAVFLLAQIFETNLLPFFAPFIGAFGSFLTGSATISNIMFGNFFVLAATNLSLSTRLVLSLAVVGSSAGNMIALADMLSGEAIVGVKNKELEIARGVIIPCLTYLLLVGGLGMFLVEII